MSDSILSNSVSVVKKSTNELSLLINNKRYKPIFGAIRCISGLKDQEHVWNDRWFNLTRHNERKRF